MERVSADVDPELSKMSDDCSVEEVLSDRGNALFRVKRFTYRIDSTVRNKLYCCCVRRDSDKCPARVIIVKVPKMDIAVASY